MVIHSLHKTNYEIKLLNIFWYTLHYSITHVAIKVHMILRRFVVLTWMRDIIELCSM